MCGRLDVVCGPMFSGKTEELLRRMNRFKYGKKEYILFKPRIDDRYSADEVVSHNKNSLAAKIIDNADEIEKICKENPQVKHIGIDEIQFINTTDPEKLIKTIVSLKRNGYHIVVAGLDMDSKGKPFTMMPQLLSIADEVRKLKSVCFDCGEDASMSHRLCKSNELIAVGSDDQYKALCYGCWVKENPEE